MSPLILKEQKTTPQLVLSIVLGILSCMAGLLPVLQWHLTVTYLPVCSRNLAFCAFAVPLSIFKYLFFPSLPYCCLPHETTALPSREMQHKKRFSATYFQEKYLWLKHSYGEHMSVFINMNKHWLYLNLSCAQLAGATKLSEV